MLNRSFGCAKKKNDQFLSLLDLNDVPGGSMAQRRYPPVALIECVADITQNHHKVRRLHLVIIDLWRSWKINQAQVRSLTGALRRLQYSADCTTSLSPQLGKTPLHGRTMALTFLVICYGQNARQLDRSIFGGGFWPVLVVFFVCLGFWFCVVWFFVVACFPHE